MRKACLDPLITNNVIYCDSLILTYFSLKFRMADIFTVTGIMRQNSWKCKIEFLLLSIVKTISVNIHTFTNINYLTSFKIINLKNYIRNIQKQPPRSVPRKRCSENMKQTYRRTAIPECDFNKVAKKHYWNRTSALIFSCKFAAYFQNTFS